MQLDAQKLIEAITQATACMYNMQKGPSDKSGGTIPTGGKPYLGKERPSEITKGLDGTTNPGLNNCSELQFKIKREQLATDSIIAEQVLHKKHTSTGVQ